MQVQMSALPNLRILPGTAGTPYRVGVETGVEEECYARVER